MYICKCYSPNCFAIPNYIPQHYVWLYDSEVLVQLENVQSAHSVVGVGGGGGGGLFEELSLFHISEAVGE